MFDIELYRVVIDGQTKIVHEWTDQLRDDFIRLSCRTIICDAWQGFSVAHDIMHVMARVAAAEAAIMANRNLHVFEFAPVPAALPGLFRLGACLDEFELDDELSQEKIRVADSYPDLHEIEEYLDTVGQRELLRETFFSPRPLETLLEQNEPPLYERFGVDRVLARRYDRPIVWNDFRPVVASLINRASTHDG